MKKIPSSPRRLAAFGKVSVLSLAAVTFQAVSPANAATVYWTGTSAGTWAATTNWSTDASTATNPSSVPDSASDVVFNMTGVNIGETITLTANQAVNSMTINNTGATSFTGSYHLSVGSGGITIGAGAGSVSFNGIKLSVVATQTWTNNSSNVVSLTSSGYSYADSTVTTPVTLTLAGAGGWSFTRANYFVDNSSTGTLSLVIDSTATNVKITGSQSYSGGTVIKGTLRAENAGALGTGTVTLDTSSSPTLTTNFAGTMSNNIVVTDGAGTATLTTVNTNSPTFSGTLTLNNATNALSVVGYTGVTITISGRITGVGKIAKITNNSTLVLSGSNDFQGGVSLSVGTLQLWSSYALGTGTLSITGGTIGNTSGSDVTLLTNNAQVWGGNFTFSGTNNLNLGTGAVSLGSSTRTVTTSTNTLTVGGVISGDSASVGLTKSGAGTLALNGLNTYTGVTTVSAGVLSVAHLADGGSASGVGASGTAAANLLLSNSSTLQYTGAGESTDRAFTINGTVADAGATLDASGSGAISFTNSASPAYGTNNQTRILTLTGTNADSNTLAANIANNGTGAVSVVKSGVGKWVLSGQSTYTGATSVKAGSLVVAAGGSLGSTAVTVDSTGSLKVNGSIGGSVTAAGALSGTGTVTGAVVINGGTLSPGNSVGTINTGALTLNSGVLDIELGRDGATVTSDKVKVTGLVTLADANLQLTLASGLSSLQVGDVVYLVYNDGTDAVSGSFTQLNGVTTTLTEGSTFTWDSQEWEITYTANAESLSTTGGNDIALIAVPEPTTWAMMLSSVGLLIGLQRMRRNRFNG